MIIPEKYGSDKGGLVIGCREPVMPDLIRHPAGLRVEPAMTAPPSMPCTTPCQSQLQHMTEDLHRQNFVVDKALII
jgi:hypothetical protein